MLRGALNRGLDPRASSSTRAVLRNVIRRRESRRLPLRGHAEGTSGSDAKDATPTPAKIAKVVDQLAQRPEQGRGTVQDVFDAVGVEMEDDLSPLRAALAVAEKRVQDSSFQRESLETEAQDVCEMALRAKDTLDQALSQFEAAGRETKKLKDQLAKMERQLELSKDELERLASSLEDSDSAIAGVEGPGGSGMAASTSEWDTDVETAQTERGAQAGTAAAAGELSATERAITERRAAILIIEERIRVFTNMLELMPAKVAALDERLVFAEHAYKQADQVAVLSMQTVEAAVKDELEARAVAAQISSAIESAIVSLKALGQYEADAVAPVAAKPVAEKTPEAQAAETHAELDLLVASQDESEDEGGASGLRAAVVAKLPWLALLAGVVALCTFTALGPALCDRFEVLSVAVQKVSALCGAIVDKVPWPRPHHGEEGLWQTIAILATSVLSVPLVMKLIPGGSAVLGFLIGGALIGPHGLGVISNVEGIKHLAEMGVVFLLFNIGLELSLERLQAMAKNVFGMGGLQFVLTTLVIAGVAVAFGGFSGPAAIILGGALSLSSTAVAMQVLQERNESGSRHGRATFAVLLLQDLGVVVLLMLVPLLANGSGGIAVIAKALGVAAVKATVCIVCMIAGGRVILRPVFRRIAGLANAEIFAATTLLVVLGSSVMTQIAGLSLALGAFLAGLLLAETEYALQVESDIAPFKGLLMGLFFMSVGMEISLGVLVQNWAAVLGSLTVLLVGKTAIMAALGPLFGFSRLSAIRSGLYLAPGGEFAFVALQEAVSCGLIASAQIPQLFIMVVLSMALTPYLAAFGTHLAKLFETKDMRLLQPSTAETAEMRDHVIIMGFGRVGQTIAQLLSERLIPFVALDVRPDRVQAGKAADLPVYFGDAGSPAVLHLVNAHHARCAVITLDTPGANYRAVWAMNKHFPHAKIYVRAHDIDNGINLEKAGATAVVPEILEPSLQLAAAVLSSMNLKQDEISDAIDTFRRAHLADLKKLSAHSGGSLGYGFDRGDVKKLPAAAAEALDSELDVLLASPAS